MFTLEPAEKAICIGICEGDETSLVSLTNEVTAYVIEYYQRKKTPNETLAEFTSRLLANTALSERKGFVMLHEQQKVLEEIRKITIKEDMK